MNDRRRQIRKSYMMSLTNPQYYIVSIKSEDGTKKLTQVMSIMELETARALYHDRLSIVMELYDVSGIIG